MNGISARLAAGSGAFFVVAILVGNVMELSGSSQGTDGAAALAGLQRDPSIVNVAGFVLAMLGFAAFVVFLGYVHGALRAAEGPDGWVATTALGAGLVSVAVKVGSIAPITAGIYRKDELTSDLARTLVDLNNAAFVLFGLLFGLFVVVTGAGCLTHRTSPRWLGWAGVVIGTLAVVAGLAGLAAPESYNPMAFVGGLAWTLVFSLVLASRGARAGETGRSRGITARADVAGAV